MLFFKICVNQIIIISAIIMGLLLPLHAQAKDIHLKLKDGPFTLKGQLIAFDGKSYVVQTANFGRMTVDAQKFHCVYGSCPDLQKTTASIQKAAYIPEVQKDFGIYGSNTIGAKLMPALIKGYAENKTLKSKRIVGNNPEEIQIQLSDNQNIKLASVDLRSHGSGTSFPGLISGEAQIGMSSRPIKTKEIVHMEKSGFLGMTNKGREHILALDGLLVITSQNNATNALSLDQVARIFSGEIQDWAEVGRKPGPINIYARDNKSGTFDTFKSLVLKPRKVKISPTAKRFESNADLSDEVANDPNGIGFTGFAYKRNSKALAISSSCGILSHPTIFNVKTEEYPLARRLYLYTTQELNAKHAREILQFSLSDEAQPIITDIGFINQSLKTLNFSQQGDRLAVALNTPQEGNNLEILRKFSTEFLNSKRLSATFRFKTGASILDNKAQVDSVRLANYLQRQDIKNKDIYLIGYADSTGDFEANRQLSYNRALSVKASILSSSRGKINPERLKVRALSEVMPVSCNNTESGRKKNRRVEVWVKG